MYTEEMVDEGYKVASLVLDAYPEFSRAQIRQLVEDIILAALSVKPVGEYD